MKKFLVLVNRYFRRLKTSLVYISKHPLTRDHAAQAYFRYFGVHIIQFCCRNLPIKFHYFDDVRFFASQGDSGIIGNIYTGLADFEEMAFLLHFLKSDDLFIDVGANVGAYTLLASGGCKSRTIAIEPMPKTFVKLEANVKLNNLSNLVECLNIGLGAREEVLNFVETPQSELNHVAGLGENPINSQKAVKVVPLDSLMSTLKPSLIKIDVEGYELEVLNGADNCLADKTLKAILIELNGSGEKYGVKDTQTSSMLTSYGFKPYSYEPLTRNLTEIDEGDQEGRDLIFIRDIDFVLNRINKAPKRKVLSCWI